MNKPDFSTMTRSQLWHYVVQNRQDQEAFYALIDRAHETPSIKIESPEHLQQLIEEHDRASSPIQESGLNESA
jgi:hypothetical protein